MGPINNNHNRPLSTPPSPTRAGLPHETPAQKMYREAKEEQAASVSKKTAGTKETPGQKMYRESMEARAASISNKPAGAKETPGQKMYRESMEARDASISNKPAGAKETPGQKMYRESMEARDASLSNKPAAAKETAAQKMYREATAGHGINQAGGSKAPEHLPSRLAMTFKPSVAAPPRVGGRGIPQDSPQSLRPSMSRDDMFRPDLVQPKPIRAGINAKMVEFKNSGDPISKADVRLLEGMSSPPPPKASWPSVGLKPPVMQHSVGGSHIAQPPPGAGVYDVAQHRQNLHTEIPNPPPAAQEPSSKSFASRFKSLFGIS
jgi:hypothetical protein